MKKNAIRFLFSIVGGVSIAAGVSYLLNKVGL
jgi:hypothetical protein